MYGEIVEDIRDGLAVSAEFDRRILRGLNKAARTLLMTYNFRASVRRAVLPIAAAGSSVVLPADVGKIKAVQLTTVEGGTKLFKVLRRRGEGQLPVYQGPRFYYTEEGNLFLDQPMPAVLATPYNIEVWYQSDDPAWAEPWLSTKYEGPLEHLAGLNLALKLRKKEAADVYSALWQQDTVILARYTAELEFSDMDMGMGERSDVLVEERYPAG